MLSISTAIPKNRAASVLPGLPTKPKARKHFAACLATGACTLATSLPAQALTFDFSFDVVSGIPSSSGTVTGTISGLADDTANQTSGLTVSNLSAPNTPAGGWPSSWNYFSGSGITVSNGSVTISDIAFVTDDNINFLQLQDTSQLNNPDLSNVGFAATFTPQSGPAPAPGPLPLLGAGAAFGWSRKLRRRISASAFRF